jgi:hypothetical protein
VLHDTTTGFIRVMRRGPWLYRDEEFNWTWSPTTTELWLEPLRWWSLPLAWPRWWWARRRLKRAGAAVGAPAPLPAAWLVSRG